MLRSRVIYKERDEFQLHPLSLSLPPLLSLPPFSLSLSLSLSLRIYIYIILNNTNMREKNVLKLI